MTKAIALSRLAARPVLDVWRGLDRCLAPPAGVPQLGLVFLGLVAGWWIYVPVHELLHAAGCLATGGTVSRLEVQPLYGGTLLAAWLPWVVAGGEYAGRLAEFDTGGSDWVYLATDLAPYVLTVFPGVFALLWAGRRGRPALYGFTLPWALAPFLSLPGDAFEIGTLAVTQVAPWRDLADTLRGDDAVLWVASAGPGAPWGGFVLSLILGLLWAYATYGLGALVARRLGATHLSSTPSFQNPPLSDLPRGAS
ncbi:MAG: hypothetical protein AAGC60_02725 [Acidobacteriota bacterium]